MASVQQVTSNGMLTVMKDMKEEFKDDKEKYNKFLKVMKDFMAQQADSICDTVSLMQRVKELFQAHTKLILGFNKFLTPGHEILVPPTGTESQQATGIKYVRKIKARFETEEQVYTAWLTILHMYRRGNKTVGQVSDEVVLLFRDHSDLLEDLHVLLVQEQWDGLRFDVFRNSV